MSTSSPSHRPRRKRKPLIRNNTLTDITTIDPSSNTMKPDFNLVAFLLPGRGTSQWILVPLIFLFTALFRWAVGYWGYSGSSTPPMFGDYEAQRHWMEITTHLPVSMWYFYDLHYWGLDYPPLTAYHSWLCGKIGSLINPDWFALDISRGFESQNLKVFMRASVILSESVTYFAALIVFLRHFSRNQGTGATASMVALVAILMQPAVLLIDHGHFQYNTVMLGWVVASLSSIYAGRLLWACVFFVAALGFKQMALYFSPVIFAYMLGSCLTPRIRAGRLIAIATVTLASIAALFAPLAIGSIYDLRRGITLPTQDLPPLFTNVGISIDSKSPIGLVALQISQVVHRMFPFARGLFEDKVANFWCFLNTFYKLRKLESLIQLPKLSLFATLMSILPSMMIIGASPRKTLLLYALASCAWGFFLFSFQVHEKSVLLPLLPMTLLLASKPGLSKEYRAWIGWANWLGVWTMFPLLRRDELKTPYVILPLLWAWLLGLPPCSVDCYYDPEHENTPGVPRPPDELSTPTKILHFWFYVLTGFWHILAAFAEPPENKPDLWVVVNACIGAVGFGICYLWCTWKLVLTSGLLDDYFSHQQMIEDQTVTSKAQKVVEANEKERNKSAGGGSMGKKKQKVSFQATT